MDHLEHTTGPVASPSSASNPPFETLDKRVVLLWRIQHLISTAILLGLLLFVGIGFAFRAPTLRLLLLIAFVSLLLLRIGLLIWLVPRRYAAWGYRLTDQVFETRHGVFSKISQMVPLSRLQHVDLQRGIFERRFGLATLVLFTAGTNHSVIFVPGLEAGIAASLRDKLVLSEGDDGV